MDRKASAATTSSLSFFLLPRHPRYGTRPPQLRSDHPHHCFLGNMAWTTTDETTPALMAGGVLATDLIAARIHIGGSPSAM
jgi:hypothetical protein